MIKSLSIKVLIFITLLAFACKEPFDPNIPAIQSNYLVVEGIINTNGVTKISLSRTVPLKDTANVKPETRAQVSIEGEDNSTFGVLENEAGVYRSDSFHLRTNQKYRLHIKTSTGGEYLSDFVTPLNTPPVDSISWKLENNGVQIYANTHDPSNNTRYYKWDYEETWEFHSAFLSSYKYINGDVKPRDYDESVKLYYCWTTQNSTSILTGSSAKLTNDAISLQPIEFIPRNSGKTSVRYSILLKQYAVDRSAYDFFEMMKKNTESLGSIFDPLPSELTGNIACVSNPKEKVIGFVTASDIEQKRIFITRDEVGSTYSMNCETTLVANNKDSFQVFYGGGGLIPYDAHFEGPGIDHYYSATPLCIDCTLRGTNVKPSFW